MKTPAEIVQATFSYLSNVVPATQKIEAVRIEELEEIDSKQFWRIVLSYDSVGQFAFDRTREYKEFKVNKETAEVVSMTIKKI